MPEVHFCNLCDQSVPLVEVEEGRARRLGDRVLCHTCRTLLAGTGAGGGRNGAGVWLAIALGLVACLAAAFLWLENDKASEEITAEMRSGFERADQRQSQIEHSLSEQAAGASEARALLSSEIGALGVTHSESRKAFDARLAEVQSSLDQFERYIGEQEQAVRQITQLEATVSVLEDRMRGYRGDLIALRDEVDRQRDLVAASVERASSDGGESSEFSPEISGLLQDLQSDDSNIRYAALERLQPLQDPRLLPHIYPALSDPYEFNRFLAAHILGEWGARAATPHLIEALQDEFGFVREAAVGALRRLTAQNFGYDHAGTPEVRRRGYKAWKSWWDENGAEFLAQAPS